MSRSDRMRAFAGLSLLFLCPQVKAEVWTSIGPSPITGNNGPTGRVASLAIDPSNPKRRNQNEGSLYRARDQQFVAHTLSPFLFSRFNQAGQPVQFFPGSIKPRYRSYERQRPGRPDRGATGLQIARSLSQRPGSLEGREHAQGKIVMTTKRIRVGIIGGSMRNGWGAMPTFRP
jgi:hypothetical protein